MKTLKVICKEVYGNPLIYPACRESKIFCELLETKTLTPRAIGKIIDLGYTLDFVSNNPPAWLEKSRLEAELRAYQS